MITDCEKTVRKILKQIPGKTNATGMKYLCKLAQSLADVPGWFIDLGTYQGRSAMVLTVASLGEGPARRIISIDNYTNGTKGGQPDFWTVKRRFKCRNRAHLVVGETDLIPPIVQGAQVALVFVNVDHRREQLDKDIAAWKPLVEPGGIMAFDGYGSDRWPDVQAVVDEAMGDWTRLDCTGNVQAFEKG